MFWLTQLAERSPGTPVSANQSSLRPHSNTQGEGWGRDTKSSTEPRLHCPRKSPSQLTVRLVPSLLYERESSLFRTASSVSLPNPTESQVRCYSFCWWPYTFMGFVVEALPFTALFIQESQVGLSLSC